MPEAAFVDVCIGGASDQDDPAIRVGQQGRLLRGKGQVRPWLPFSYRNLNDFRTVLEVGWVVDQVAVSRITEFKDPGSCLLWELVFYSSSIRSSLVASP